MCQNILASMAMYFALWMLVQVRHYVLRSIKNSAQPASYKVQTIYESVLKNGCHRQQMPNMHTYPQYILPYDIF